MNDLLILQMLEGYKEVDSKIAKVVEGNMKLHLWYLSEDLAALPLFSDDSSDVEKKAIVSAMQKNPLPEDVHCVPPRKISKFCNLSVADFGNATITQSTQRSSFVI